MLEPFDTTTPFCRAMLGILAVFAQLERDTIVERSK
ncbi:DNA invertase Pin-like site-specific DNA recombinase [Brassicibacter mesophilus]